MNKPNFHTFQKISSSHPELPTVIAPSIGNSTSDEKMQKILGGYEEPGHYLVGSFEANRLIGVVGLEIQGKTGIIKHIAVLPTYRLQGIGKALIKHVIDHFFLKTLHAETDEDAVDFYRKLKFACQPFEGLYGKRYQCNYRP